MNQIIVIGIIVQTYFMAHVLITTFFKDKSFEVEKYLKLDKKIEYYDAE